MGRMKVEQIKEIKRRVMLDGYLESGHPTILNLVNHAEAIELELKISKEDEQEAVRKYGEAELNIDRLTENVAQLQLALTKKVAECTSLNLALHEAREPKKVALPKEKADALKWAFMNHSTNAGVIHRYTSDNYIGPKTDVLRSIPLDTLLSALVNGYTVEKTKEDRLREGIEGIIDHWFVATSQSPAKAAKDIMDFVTKFNAENN